MHTKGVCCLCGFFFFFGWNHIWKKNRNSIKYQLSLSWFYKSIHNLRWSHSRVPTVLNWKDLVCWKPQKESFMLYFTGRKNSGEIWHFLVLWLSHQFCLFVSCWDRVSCSSGCSQGWPLNFWWFCLYFLSAWDHRHSFGEGGRGALGSSLILGKHITNWVTSLAHKMDFNT